jgi:hypothetical protein
MFKESDEDEKEDVSLKTKKKSEIRNQKEEKREKIKRSLMF